MHAAQIGLAVGSRSAVVNANIADGDGAATDDQLGMKEGNDGIVSANINWGKATARH